MLHIAILKNPVSMLEEKVENRMKIGVSTITGDSRNIVQDIFEDNLPSYPSGRITSNIVGLKNQVVRFSNCCN